MRVESKLRATFRRSIYAGVSRLHNLALRRFQLSSMRNCAAPLISFASLALPFISEPATRTMLLSLTHVGSISQITIHRSLRAWLLCSLIRSRAVVHRQLVSQGFEASARSKSFASLFLFLFAAVSRGNFLSY